MYYQITIKLFFLKPKNMKNLNVTIKELTQILLEVKLIKGMNMFASVLQLTEPKCTVKDRNNKENKNPYQKIQKLSKVSILLNADYVTAVTNQLERENKETSEYKQGTNTMPLVFGENNQFLGFYGGSPVLQYRPNDNIKPKSKYLADSKLIDKKKIEGFLPLEKHAENQGTEREIFWRKLYLKNIIKLTFNGQTYKIIGE